MKFRQFCSVRRHHLLSSTCTLVRLVSYQVVQLSASSVCALTIIVRRAPSYIYRQMFSLLNSRKVNLENYLRSLTFFVWANSPIIEQRESTPTLSKQSGILNTSREEIHHTQICLHCSDQRQHLSYYTVLS